MLVLSKVSSAFRLSKPGKQLAISRRNTQCISLAVLGNVRHPSSQWAKFSMSTAAHAASDSVPVAMAMPMGARPARVQDVPNPPSSPPINSLVFVEPAIMSFLQLRHKKTRFLLSTKQPNALTLSEFKAMIEHRFQPLKEQPYKLKYNLEGDLDVVARTIATDEQLHSAMQQAAEKGVSLQFFVSPTIGVFPPPNFEALPISADPLEADSYTMVSFFSFERIQDKEETSWQLQRLWAPFKALGRVYVANEGINAQMAIPTNVFEDFKRATKKNALFAESRFNTDPSVSKEEYLKTQPFRALHVRVRDQIVADGLDEELDWRRAGNELDPLQWHRELENPEAIILDCRNNYETDVGKFEGARPLNTTFFRESWVALEEVLKDKPKDTPVLTYCTGGIRCVKINAYLEQKMGFTNTHRLKGGVIAYRRELEEFSKQEQQNENTNGDVPGKKEKESPASSGLESKFKGVNYVFDERIVERITDDIFAQCETCGAPNDAFTNCKNDLCNVRFIQCSKCRGSLNHCCSQACKVEFELQREKPDDTSVRRKLRTLSASPFNKPLLSRKSSQSLLEKTIEAQASDDDKSVKSHAIQTEEDTLVSALNQYCEQFSEREPDFLKSLRELTTHTFPHSAARMISGPSQGALLSFLASVSNAQSVLELGTFTGYSALSLAMNFNDFSSKSFSPSMECTRKVITCDIDSRASDIAQQAFSTSPFREHISLQKISAADMLQKAKDQKLRFDIVFIDADKKKYSEYLQTVVGDDPSTSLLRPGALIVVDNTLWKGLVLNEVDDLKHLAPEADEFGNSDRFLKIAKHMHEFNTFVASHPKLRALMLPMRDGLTVLRYVP